MSREMLRGLGGRFGQLLFGARWLLAPLYAGMIFALIAIVVVFARELIFEISHLGTLNVERAAVLALSLVDLSLIGNLLLVVMLAGYGSFVSPFRIGAHDDRPDWLGTVTFPSLKIRVIASIVAISAIELLRSFLLLGDPSAGVDPQRLRWMVVLQLTFVASGVLLALMDWISANTDQRSGAQSSGKLPAR